MNRRNRHSQYSRPSQSDKAWGLIAARAATTVGGRIRRIQVVKQILALSLVLCLQGCASAPYQRIETTQLDQDHYACERDVAQSNVHTGAENAPINVLIFGDPARRMYGDCMKAKGWTK
jgi:hypothetical protein